MEYEYKGSLSVGLDKLTSLAAFAVCLELESVA